MSRSGRKFSIERLLALEEYCKRTSSRRVLLVCLLTPLPIVTIVFLQESMPLQDPKEGWSKNYGLWVRSSILVGMLTCSMTVHASRFVDGVVITTRQLLLLILSQAFLVPVVELAVAACWVFPIPFMNFTLNPPFMIMFAVCFRLICGENTWRQLISHQAELIQLVTYTSTQLVLAILYPLHQVLFNYSTGTGYELPVILLLPIVKIVMKHFLARTVDQMQDIVPEAVIFSVNLFNALYIATCMQNASSSYTVAMTMVVNVVLTTIELRDIMKRTTKLAARLSRIVGKNKNLIDGICALCYDHHQISQQERKFTRVHSTILYHLSNESRSILAHLDSASRIIGAMQSTSPTVRELEQPPTESCFTTTISSIHPKPFIKPRVVEFTNSSVQDSTVLNETLEVFFTMECVVLVEYLESIIPVMYGFYSLVMVHLPSIKYHKELEGVTIDNIDVTLQRVFAYAILEFLSLLILAVLIKRTCGFQILYHLAFVLDSQVALVQCHLAIWMLLILTSSVHY